MPPLCSVAMPENEGFSGESWHVTGRVIFRGRPRLVVNPSKGAHSIVCPLRPLPIKRVCIIPYYDACVIFDTVRRAIQIDMRIANLKELRRVLTMLTALDNSTVDFPVLVQNQGKRVRTVTATKRRFYAYTNDSGHVDIITQSELSTYSTKKEGAGG